MKTQYDNRTLTPPDPPDMRALIFGENEEKFKALVRNNFKMEDIYDTYDHDREIALKFYKWALDYSSIHLVGLLKGDYPTQDELWEIYSNQP